VKEKEERPEGPITSEPISDRPAKKKKKKKKKKKERVAFV